MLSGSSISVIMVLAEATIALAVVVCFVHRKLKSSRNETKTLAQILDEERSPKKFREKLKDYFEQEIKRTNQRHQELQNQGEQNKRAWEILLTRKSALDIEKKAAQKNPLDVDYWTSVQQAYSGILPKVEAEPALKEIDEVDDPKPVAKKPSTATGDTEIAINRAATEELDRLRNVINNQYQSIDSLKRQLLDINDDPNLAGHPLMEQLNSQVSQLVAEQDQMSMCIKVLEAENERLGKQLHDLEQQGHASGQGASEAQESEVIQRMAQEHQQAENLIRDLIRTNKEQLQCIATLESELELKGQSERRGVDDDSPVMESLQKAKNEIKQLTQDKLQYLSRINDLQQRIDELEQAETGTESDKPKKELEKQLHAKIAELELLRDDYHRMHQKYIKLCQEQPGKPDQALDDSDFSSSA